MRRRVNNNKGFKMRVLAGSLAVLMAASNMASTPAFAAENPEDPIQIESQLQEEETYVEEEAPVEEAYENYVDNRMAEINDIEENKEYNDIQKLVRKAFAIGGESDWINGDSKVFDLMRDATRVLQGGSTADPEDRSYFDVLYDYHKDSSLFAGEAMQQAEKLINARVQRFMATGSQVMDILGFSRQVAELSDDQVASMDQETRSMYDRIKSAKSAVEKKFQAITDVFTKPVKAAQDDKGKKTKGIFETANDYYNKDKTVYIDKGTKEVDVKDQLKVRKSSDYFEMGYYNDWVYMYGKPTYKKTNQGTIAKKVEKKVKEQMKDSGLARDDINMICDQAKKKGMTIKEYLRYCGFDVSNMGNGILVRDGYQNGSQAGASGYHVDGYEKVKGKSHDCKNDHGRMTDYYKAFNVDNDKEEPWIYRHQDENDDINWYLFFEKE